MKRPVILEREGGGPPPWFDIEEAFYEGFAGERGRIKRRRDGPEGGGEGVALSLELAGG